MKNQKRKDLKLEQIVAAAIEEFSREPYHKVSVFKIAEKAQISRASFYCYFKSKDEIYEYILNDIKKEFIETYLGDNTIDYFEFLKNLFQFFISFKNSKRHKLFLMMLENLRAENINVFMSKNKFPSLMEKIDYSPFKQVSDATLCVLFKSNFACVAGLAVFYFKDLASEKQVRETFENYINIIKFGAYKN